MRIDKIFIKNFRAIGEPGLELTFANNCTTFIGENNVGKSSILEAIKRLLQPQVAWDKEDWHAGDQTRTIELRLDGILDDAQIKKIVTLLDLPLTGIQYKEIFGDTLIYIFRRTTAEAHHLFRFGDFFISEGNTQGFNGGWVRDNAVVTHNQTHWDQFVKPLKTLNDMVLVELIKERLAELHKNHTKIYFTDIRHISASILSILKQSVVLIEEFREKPHQSLVEVQASPTGKELASVLFNLKNARPEQKKKFEQIQAKFHKLFPALELDVIRESSEIKIHIQKAGVESTTFYLGAGIIESLLLITHLIAHDDKVLCVDSPELHLHPHTQRRLGSFIEESKDSQILVITHSPYFVSLKKGNGIQRVIQKTAQTEIIEPPKNYFDDGDYAKLEQFLDIDAKELFFARKVILVEGPTELGALPIFASNLDYDLDENGISVINVGGKSSFEFFAKLCEGFKIPYLIVADKDAERLLTNLEPKIILIAEFDDLLPAELRAEAARLVGDSKPRIGRYAARKMVTDRNFPEEIKQIIAAVKSL